MICSFAQACTLVLSARALLAANTSTMRLLLLLLLLRRLLTQLNFLTYIYIYVCIF